MGEMYNTKDGYNGDDYVVMAELENVVCLMNARTNNLHWVTRHVLNLDYIMKAPTKSEDKESV